MAAADTGCAPSVSINQPQNKIKGANVCKKIKIRIFAATFFPLMQSALYLIGDLSTHSIILAPSLGLFRKGFRHFLSKPLKSKSLLRLHDLCHRAKRSLLELD
jgi:hypothetical protein